MIKLHPEACEAFEKRINDLHSLIQTKPALQDPPRPSDPDVHISAHITDADIRGEMQLGHVDALGNPIDRWVARDGQLVGLEGEPFQEFRQLCASIQRTSAFRDCVSQTYIEDRTFEWLTTDDSAKQGFSNFIQDKVNEAQRTESYWIPIAHLKISRPIQIGQVVFRRITKSMIDAMESSHAPYESEDVEQAVRQFILRLRKQVQGYTAGTITLTSELDRGRALAMDAVDTALSVLRFFEPGSVDPDQTSFVVPLGQESRGVQVCFTLDGETPANWQEAQISNRSMTSLMDTKFIEEMWPNGLAQISAIVGKQNRSKYETKLIEALTIYSRVSISPQLSDKLVYALVALESIFLKNASEPISKNLGERISFLIGENFDRRKEIVALIDQIYGIRSQLLHHGKQVSDDEKKVKEFLFVAWSGLHAVVTQAHRFSAIDELLTLLDDRKMA